MPGSSNGGAYGFRLVPGDGHCGLPDLVEVPPDAPEVVLSWGLASSLFDADETGDDFVVIAHRTGGWLRVERDPGRIVALSPRRTTAETMVHPIATMPLSLLASWRGHATLHGGAFQHEGRAWVLCGEQTAGKSTTLALLAQRGIPVIADDLVVIDGDQVLAGPNCVDLRPETAARIPGARSLGMVAERHRYRLATPPSPASTTIAGICLLEWSEEGAAESRPLSMPERVELLHRHHYAGRLGPPRPEQVFAMLEVPMWKLRRGLEWSAAERSVDELLDLAARG